MPNETARSHGIMEGQGAYNRYAKLPAGGAALALPLLEKAVHSLELNADDQPIVIVDYGSSQGKNSMIPMQIAIRVCASVSVQPVPSRSSTWTSIERFQRAV